MISSSSVISSASSSIVSSSSAPSSSTAAQSSVISSSSTLAVTSSSSAASSSLSSAVPTTLSTAPSSSAALATSSSSLASSTRASSTVSSSTPSPSCNVNPLTNYLTNPGLETSGTGSNSAASWVETEDNTWSTSSGVYSTTGRTGANTRLLLGRTGTSNNVGNLYYTQTLTNIPSGATKVSLSAWVRVLANIPTGTTTNVFTIQLYIDGVSAVTFTPVRADVNAWKQISTSAPVTLTPAASHEFKLVVTSKGYPNTNVIYVDDFSLTAACA
ncbi:hypothetical protein IQ07DRAFT_686037 [Pyrenochaeta sp. DS3sAY3a]|nr:hypothetical protein IQ07DRAFT_686037 [Pyrenochaeta sp. DS3sAY3a]